MNTYRCHHCHNCGTELKKVLDGEEWCPVCKMYRRYRSHGWTHALADNQPCPDTTEMRLLQAQTHLEHASPDCQCNICTYGREAPCFANEY